MLNTNLQSLHGSFGALQKEVDTLIEYLTSNPLCILSWKDAQSTESFYNSYREAIKREEEVARHLVKIARLRLLLSIVRENTMRDPATPESIKLNLRNQFDRWSDMLRTLNESLLPAKDALANILRFYNSSQYLISSPRYSTTDM